MFLGEDTYTLSDKQLNKQAQLTLPLEVKKLWRTEGDHVAKIQKDVLKIIYGIDEILKLDKEIEDKRRLKRISRQTHQW